MHAENPPTSIAVETAAKLNRRTLHLVLILVPMTVLSLWLVYTQQRTTRVAALAASAIPAVIETPAHTWASSSLMLSERELDVLETRDYVFRTYADGRGKPVDLVIVFSEDNRKGTHPPDVCLEGSGSRIMMRYDRTVHIDGVALQLRELVTTNGPGRYSYFAYFYKCGDMFTPSFYRQQAQTVLNGLMNRNAAGALVRYSVTLDNPQDLPNARARVDQLLEVTFPHIKSKLNLSH